MIIIDTECYPNFWLFAALDTDSGKVTTLELSERTRLDTKTLRALMQGKTLGFNSKPYDLPMITAALRGDDNAALKRLSDALINAKKPWQVLRHHHLDVPRWDHIDIIGTLIGQASLKIYAGRLHAKRLQDLPYSPGAMLTNDQMDDVTSYCRNDLDLTRLVYESIVPQIALREVMSEQYGVDLRSKSDAQIAETVITRECEVLIGRSIDIPSNVGQTYKYRFPKYFRPTTDALREVANRIHAHMFEFGENGNFALPEWMSALDVKIGDSVYRMGVGGLHSCEQGQFYECSGMYRMTDWDVASYYPNIILAQALFPPHIGREFLNVYKSIVDRRLTAKKAGDKTVADTLKIVANGSYGKLGSKYSKLYAPSLALQVTLTGQLSLLLLIERFEAAGVKVISANTDGVVTYYPAHLQDTVEGVAWDWMLDTSFELERAEYRMLASANVNNYVAVKTDGKRKVKGWFALGGLSKNPDGEVIYEAVANYLADWTPVEDTIHACHDLRKFLTLRTVKGGAVWMDKPIGKAVRFYHSTEVPLQESLHYASNGNRVPESSGCRPCMGLPNDFPEDIDYEYYICSAIKILKGMGKC